MTEADESRRAFLIASGSLLVAASVGCERRDSATGEGEKMNEHASSESLELAERVTRSSVTSPRMMPVSSARHSSLLA